MYHNQKHMLFSFGRWVFCRIKMYLYQNHVIFLWWVVFFCRMQFSPLRSLFSLNFSGPTCQGIINMRSIYMCRLNVFVLVWKRPITFYTKTTHNSLPLDQGEYTIFLLKKKSLIVKMMINHMCTGLKSMT